MMTRARLVLDTDGEIHPENRKDTKPLERERDNMKVWRETKRQRNKRLFSSIYRM